MPWLAKTVKRVKAEFSDDIRGPLNRLFLKWVSSPDTSRSGKIRSRLADRFPSFSSTVTALQSVEKTRLERDEEEFKESRIPEGVKIKYLGFCLLETFHLEDLRQLEEAHSTLFPNPPLLDIGLTDPAEHFQRDAGKLTGNSWMPLGLIVRDEASLDVGHLRGLLTLPERKGHSRYASRVMPELPPEVESILFEQQQVLPSLFVVNMYVFLTDGATQKLMSLHERRYTPELKLEGLTEGEILYSLVTTPSAEDLRKQAISDWLTALRGEVEARIRPLLQGHFTKRSTSRGPRLPAVEMFALEGAPELKDTEKDTLDFLEWGSKAVDWSGSFGMNFSSFDYESNLALFSWPSEHESVGGSPCQLIVFKESCVRHIKEEAAKTSFSPSMMFSGITTQADHELAQFAASMFTSMLPGIAVFQSLNQSQKSVEKLRQSVFGGMKRKLRLRSGFKLIDKVQRQSMLVDRFSIEFNKEKFWPWRPFTDRRIEVMGLYRWSTKGENGRENFIDGTQEDIRLKIELLKSHLSHIKAAVSERITLRNTVAMNRLTIIATIATVVATLAGVLSVPAGWKSIVEFYQLLRQWLGAG